MMDQNFTLPSERAYRGSLIKIFWGARHHRALMKSALHRPIFLNPPRYHHPKFVISREYPNFMGPVSVDIPMYH